MYIYGGYIADKATYMKNIYCLNLEKMEWKLVYEAGRDGLDPEPRSSSAMVVFRDALWVFGGSNGVRTISDMWKFDLKVGKWSKV